jgi:hypothetical protein
MDRRTLLAAAGAAAVLPHAVRAQVFPSRPISIYVAFPAGGPTDQFFRTLAESASKALNQAVIVESEMKKCKNSSGSYLELKFQLVDEPYKNRFVWARLNIENTNEITRRIARSELADICRATGVMNPHDSVDLQYCNHSKYQNPEAKRQR